MRIRSPGYPSDGLKECVEIVGKIFQVSRQNTIDREAAAKDIGYSGLTGQSAKILANLAHFNLVERSGKGGVRVTDLAVRILLPRNSDEKRLALIEAAYSPQLFMEIKETWLDGFVSENALRGHLMRNGFASVAVDPAMKSYTQTYGFLQQEGATESHRLEHRNEQTTSEAGCMEAITSPDRILVGVPVEASRQPVVQPAQRTEGVKLMDGERVVFVEEGGPAQYLKVVASGDLDETLLEALEDYIKRQKKRLAQPKQPAVSRL